MMRLVRLTPAIALFLLPAGAAANNGQEGAFEFAIDAPWRIEPFIEAGGRLSYGAIPITIVITDESHIPFDNPLEEPYKNQIGDFCELRVFDGAGNWRRTVGFDELAEIERTGDNSTTWINGAWQPANSGFPETPPHAICRPREDACAGFRSPHGTSEWYASTWYQPQPQDNFTSGADLALTLTAIFTRSASISCDSEHSADFISLTNHVSIHAGEEPLPRFDDRWAYGDLHYHSQGTDNEGEEGYGYRGTLKAMGAMGLDFVLATEHASSSTQIVDVDYNGKLSIVFEGLTSILQSFPRALRDMSAARFRFLHGELWNGGGANRTSAREVNESGAPPQNVRTRGTAPQIFLGGEVDVIPELPADFGGNFFHFGWGGQYMLSNLCGGWNNPITRCDDAKTREQRNGAMILKDVQGFDEYHPARAHMVYMPRTASDANAFVASRTGIFGGASRQLASGADAILAELENPGGDPKGYVFLAHPVPFGACDGGAPNMRGGEGPDVVPYTARMLDQAFRSEAVLGLEFWNEDIRMLNKPGEGATVEVGFHDDDDDGGYGFRNSPPKGFNARVFETYPWAVAGRPSYARSCNGVEWMLYNGAGQWDRLLLKGLSLSETARIRWLPAGEPRRLFMAGGSDAHGDLNYHRAGYFQGLSQIDDMAIGKPRNLVMAGAPTVNLTQPVFERADAASQRARVRSRLRETADTAAVADRAASSAADPTGRTHGETAVGADIRAFGHDQILSALQAGTFSVTDGPALRIAIDKNNNGVIDEADAPMGSVVETYGDKIIPLMVEWRSTQEWGLVYQVDIVVGAVFAEAGTPELGSSVVFAPRSNGPRTAQTAADDHVHYTRAVGDGREIHQRSDGYYDDPTGGRLRLQPVSFSGTRRIDIPFDDLRINQEYKDGRLVTVKANRVFLRAFARSQQMVGGSAACKVDPKIGRCIPRYAFTNPIWTIEQDRPGGVCPANRPRAIDSDADGLPDGCDPCPHTKRSICGEAPPPRDRPVILDREPG